MKPITHREAQELIQRSSSGPDEAALLNAHLHTCAECSDYARTDQTLRRRLAVSPVRHYPTPAMRQTVLAAARRGQSRTRMAQLGSSLAFLVVLALVGATALYAFLVTAPGSQPAGSEAITDRLASPLQTMAAIVAPPTTETAEPRPTVRAVPESPTGRIIVDVPAPSLANSVIGEATIQPVAVILPPSYATSDRRYPVGYFFATGDQSPDRTDDDTLIELIANKLTGQGSTQEMILVVPGVRTVLGTEAIIANSPITGNWEDYIVEDLVPFIDENFRTLPQAASRGLVGGGQESGLNVLNLAIGHPDVFSVVHSHQPWLMAPDRVDEDITLQPVIRQRASRTFSELASLSPQQASDGYVVLLKTMNIRSPMRLALANGMATATLSTNNAPYFEYPYVDKDTPAPEAVWQRWQSVAGNWDVKIAAYLSGPDRLKATRISRDKDFVFKVENDAIDYLVQQLARVDIPVELHTTDRYGSVWVTVLENEALPFLSQHLKAQ